MKEATEENSGFLSPIPRDLDEKATATNEIDRISEDKYTLKMSNLKNNKIQCGICNKVMFKYQK